MFSRVYRWFLVKCLDWLKSDPNTCEHDWYVVSTVVSTVQLQTVCYDCMTFAVVNDPSAEEWSKAYEAPNNPYKWEDGSRVVIENTDEK